jgi:hypothetical protein
MVMNLQVLQKLLSCSVFILFMVRVSDSVAWNGWMALKWIGKDAERTIRNLI